MKYGATPALLYQKNCQQLAKRKQKQEERQKRKKKKKAWQRSQAKERRQLFRTTNHKKAA